MGLGEIVIIALLAVLIGLVGSVAALVVRRGAAAPDPSEPSVPSTPVTEPVAAAPSLDLEGATRALASRERALDARESSLVAREKAVETSASGLVAERAELRELRQQLEAREARLGHREVRLEAEQASLTADREALGDEQQRLSDRESAVATRESDAAAGLTRLAQLTPEEAKAEVLARVEHEARLEAMALARGIEQDARRTADARARDIITTAIQRMAAAQTADSVLTAVELPHESLKGRVIGREGRNIRTFEQVTGVNVLIDDTPGVVVLSSFDPVRREAARLTLEELVADGRIHPARIEEEHARSLERVEEICLEAADEALAEMGITDLPEGLRPVLGSLRFRTSYGQNVLAHLVECGHLASMMASELGLDPTTARRAAFLHDIGKALTPEVEGSHAIVGADLARSHGESPDVVHAIEAHHNEVEPQTVEAWLVQAADSISGSRPAARREPLEAYVQRLESLERIALEHDGVDRVFAMHAGREIRVMVLPEVVDDLAAQDLAREIAREFESEVTFPGEIRVTVVRESRATATAH